MMIPELDNQPLRAVPHSDLRDHYDEIAAFCRHSGEPVFLMKDGREDLAALSPEAYHRLMSRLTLYERLSRGRQDQREERSSPDRDALADLEAAFRRGARMISHARISMPEAVSVADFEACEGGLLPSGQRD